MSLRSPAPEPAPAVGTDAAVVLKGGLADLQRARERLEEAGIDAEILRPPGEDGCSSGGCSPSMLLVVPRDDAAAAHSVFQGDWRRGMDDAQIAASEAASQVVIDPDAAETTCPACLTKFATGPSACPDCGLALG